MTVSVNARFIFKWCSCQRVCRGSEWRKHIKDAPSVPHEKRFHALVCTTCKEMCTELGNAPFLSKHKSCLQKKACLEEVKAYLSSVREKLEGRTEDEVAVDDIQPISENLTSSSESESETSSSEEEEEEEVAAAPELAQLPSDPLELGQVPSDPMSIHWDPDFEDFATSTPFGEVEGRRPGEEERRAAEKEEERRTAEEKKAEAERRAAEKKAEAERRAAEEKAEAERRKEAEKRTVAGGVRERGRERES